MNGGKFVKLYELTVSQLSSLLKKKEINAVELTRTVLDRIVEAEPVLDCYINIIEEQAVERAEKVQKMMDAGELYSPLAGIPMAVKDNICTEGIPTTCASKMLQDFVPPYNAAVMQKLYNNGAILLGKLNMDEFAMGSSTENSYFKKTKNPWNHDRVPGGSSGGCAAAVAAGEAIYSLGTDTGGSLRQPSALCGVTGFKPTYGSVSRFGLIGYASSFDQIGPVAKDVTDSALVLNAIAGHDSQDSTSAGIKYPDYTESLVNNVKNMKIGIPSEYMRNNTSEDVRKAVSEAIELFEKLGAKCEEFSLPIMEYVLPTYCIITFAEASSNLGRYDGVKYGHRAKDYKDLGELYKRTRDEGFGSEVKRRIILGTYVLSAGQYDKYYKKALQARRVICHELNRAFDKYDLIMGPTSPSTAFRFGTKVEDPAEMYKNDVLTMPANIAGLPAISVPCGFDGDSMPIGLQFIGKQFGESTLLRAAYTFEQNTDFHKNKPVIKPVI